MTKACKGGGYEKAASNIVSGLLSSKDKAELEGRLSQFLKLIGEAHTANTIATLSIAHALIESGNLSKLELTDSLELVRSRLKIAGPMANATLDEFRNYIERDWPKWELPPKG